MTERFRGDTILLRDGTEVLFLDIDERGWPIVQMPGGRIVPIAPVEVQEGWHDSDDSD